MSNPIIAKNNDTCWIQQSSAAGCRPHFRPNDRNLGNSGLLPGLLWALCWVFCWILYSGPAKAENAADSPLKPLVIAHRGASGYLPEHTLPAKALAFGMGADFVEQDVVLTRDGVPVVLHDIRLESVTNVAVKFPGRARDDGKYYVIDFSWDEIQGLDVSERFTPASGQAVYPARFPVKSGRFRIPSLASEIELIQGMNRSTGRNVGIYVELKRPDWHRQEGQDISRVVLAVLGRYGYRGKQDRVFLQCFDDRELIRLRRELGCRLRLIQLIGQPDWEGLPDHSLDMLTAEGLSKIASYADGIGPWMPFICAGADGAGRPKITDLVRHAHREGLKVHPFTFRADDLPEYAESMDWLLDVFFLKAGVDGVFTDHPDQVVRFLNK